jgi:hypothetical protein
MVKHLKDTSSNSLPYQAIGIPRYARPYPMLLHLLLPLHSNRKYDLHRDYNLRSCHLITIRSFLSQFPSRKNPRSYALQLLRPRHGTSGEASSVRGAPSNFITSKGFLVCPVFVVFGTS